MVNKSPRKGKCLHLKLTEEIDTVLSSNQKLIIFKQKRKNYCWTAGFSSFFSSKVWSPSSWWETSSTDFSRSTWAAFLEGRDWFHWQKAHRFLQSRQVGLESELRHQLKCGRDPGLEKRSWPDESSHQIHQQKSHQAPLRGCRSHDTPLSRSP